VVQAKLPVMDFNGLSLLGAPGKVMVPRATSEQLVAAAASHLGDRHARAVDVGTGSGAIAIAIAAGCPNAEIWATDIDPDAVSLARANVCRHSLEKHVFVRQGDLLAPLAGRFDLIVANLPYLPVASAADHPELREEPFMAVFAGGDGLGAYRRLVDAAAGRLTGSGLLILQLRGRAVLARLPELPALRAALGPRDESPASRILAA
jgi:release factor glutamine methyltransferase